MNGQRTAKRNSAPTPRDIFYKFNFSDQTTLKFEENARELNDKFDKIIEEFDVRNEIDVLLNDGYSEAQVMGFEQGFKYAVRLLFLGISENPQLN